MPSTSIAMLVDELRAAQVLTPSQAAEVARRARAFTQPKALVRHLTERGWLTDFQGQHLLQDRLRELLVGPYILLEPLGEGAAARVYRARHRRMGRVVALKVLPADHPDRTAVADHFAREARAGARLAHPNIVQVYDADEDAGCLFLAMEFVDGLDLDQLVRRQGPLPVRQAFEIARQAACALQHAHELGLVHRDVKPANLLLASAPAGGLTVKLLDLGLARGFPTADPAAPDDTPGPEDDIVGTIDYVAPEQARDPDAADIRADLYSLGGTLYFLLTGQPPFPDGPAHEKLLRHQFDLPRPVEELRPEVPASFAALVRRLMAKRPHDRFPTPAHFEAALAALLGADGALPADPPTAVPTAVPTAMPAAMPAAAAPRSAPSVVPTPPDGVAAMMDTVPDIRPRRPSASRRTRLPRRERVPPRKVFPALCAAVILAAILVALLLRVAH